ncbi:MAG: (Fe-S)-binding protein [Candidatus Brocadiia bacterium]
MSPESKSPRDIHSCMDAAKEALKKAAHSLGAYHLNACVRCGLCGETCHIYIADPVPENLPGVKASKVVSFYRRYHTLSGQLLPSLVGARDITPDALDELVETVFGRCTGCGRCGINCSIGLDVGAVMRIGRKIVSAAGKTPPSLCAVVGNQLADGNQMSISPDEVRKTADWICEDLRAEMADDSVTIPVDEHGRRILYLVNPREIKFFPLSLAAAAGVFHAAGESWTVASKFFDVTNYGLFAGDDESAAHITRNVLEEAERLGVEEVILSECGHGYRSFRWEGPNWTAAKYSRPVRSILELMVQYLETHRIKADRTKNLARVTLHDPCNLVRWGGLIEAQRRILRVAVSDFVEMTPNKEQNYCCGGGGGMLSMSEYGERRIASGKIKADQIRATGAKIVATPCHNCADQLIELNKRYKLGVEILSVVELLYNALDRSKAQSPSGPA